MRNSTFFKAVSGAVLASTALMGVALAQTNPSAQQLINSLKPSGSVSETTRGIKPLAPGNSSDTPVNASAAMTKPAAPHVYAAKPTGSANMDIMFRSGSADLTPQATTALTQLGKALTSHELAVYNFKIVGHTDTTGDAAANQSLSEQRAQAVKTFLETKYGVADSRLQATGVGESDLLVSTPPQTPELRNRRVQILNLGQ